MSVTKSYNYNDFDKLCHNMKNVHKSFQIKTLSDEIKKIELEQKKCLCKYFDQTINCNLDISIQTLMAEKCLKTCNFCCHKNKVKFYKKIKHFELHKIKLLIPKEILFDYPEILSDIMTNRILELPINEIVKFANSNIVFSDNVKAEILNQIYLMDTIDVECREIQLIKILIENTNIVENNHSFIMDFLTVTIKKTNLFFAQNFIPKNKLSILFEYALQNKIFDLASDIVKNMENKIYISRQNFSKFFDFYKGYISYFEMQIVFSKIENINELLCYRIKNLKFHRINFVVNNEHYFESFMSYNHPEIIKDIQNIRNIPTIIYMNDTETMGSDAGGLTKDFYTNLFAKLETIMCKIDDHFIPTNIINENYNWRLFGILFFRAIFTENIVTNFRLHPLLCYFLVQGHNIKNIKDFLSNISKYDIGIFTPYTLKLFELTDDEFKLFIELQDETINDPVKINYKIDYIKKIINQKYINRNVIAFVNGFQHMFTQAKDLVDKEFFNHITESYLYNQLTKTIVFNINDNSIHSLKNNCEFNVTNGKFKDAFLLVLHELNKNDPDKLKKFIYYWLGSISYDSFYGLKCKIEETKNNLYGCFRSCTCFNTLYIEKLLSSDIKTIKIYILSAINRSLDNQSLSESVGLNMQLM
jgi:hypothetical protein